METINRITVSSPIVGRHYTFIYCLYFYHQAEQEGIVYIGETDAQNGPLGRLSYHLQLNGTFYTRCYEKARINIDLISDDIHMLVVCLDNHPEFCGDVNKTNRLALEYFVHIKMQEYSVADQTVIPFEVVSNVTIAKRHATNEQFQAIASSIADSFFQSMPFICEE